ncbi:MAG: hypothetical protein JSV78_08010 [Phycisphaerales bacterium]|nr:MAG: hypothetical protein JSV78_08010 [Phycisphaerales bacterium]
MRITLRCLSGEPICFDECAGPEQDRQKEEAFKDGRTRDKPIEPFIRDFPQEPRAPISIIASQEQVS